MKARCRQSLMQSRTHTLKPSKGNSLSVTTSAPVGVVNASPWFLCSHYLGEEHLGTDTTPANPSYCTLPMFHPPAYQTSTTANGYVSGDGHVYNCRNPILQQQAYHV